MTISLLDDSIAAAEKRRPLRVCVAAENDVFVHVVPVKPVLAIRLQKPAAAPPEKVDRILPTPAAEGRSVRVSAVTMVPEVGVATGVHPLVRRHAQDCDLVGLAHGKGCDPRPVKCGVDCDPSNPRIAHNRRSENFEVAAGLEWGLDGLVAALTDGHPAAPDCEGR